MKVECLIVGLDFLHFRIMIYVFQLHFSACRFQALRSEDS